MTTDRRNLEWRGDTLCVGSRELLRVGRDERWPSMFRVALPNGWRSDLLNCTRARDLAVLLARKVEVAGLESFPSALRESHAGSSEAVGSWDSPRIRKRAYSLPIAFPAGRVRRRQRCL
jgi:hypothetical protein